MRRWRDSEIRRETKATSPPGVIISDAEPVQAEEGGRCLVRAERRREERVGWKGGFVRVKVRLGGLVGVGRYNGGDGKGKGEWGRMGNREKASGRRGGEGKADWTY